MLIGVMLQSVDPQKAFDCFRFGNAALANGHQVEVFLMGDAVKFEEIESETYDVFGQAAEFTQNGGRIAACGKCLQRHSVECELAPLSNMKEFLDIISRADKMLTF